MRISDWSSDVCSSDLAGLTRARSFADDPLELYGHYLLQLLPAGGKLTPRAGVLMLERSDGVDILVTATLRDSPFQLSVQNRAMPPLEAAMRYARSSRPGVPILGSGVLRHPPPPTAPAHHNNPTNTPIPLVRGPV